MEGLLRPDINHVKEQGMKMELVPYLMSKLPNINVGACVKVKKVNI
jgi:hypothetical protein